MKIIVEIEPQELTELLNETRIQRSMKFDCQSRLYKSIIEAVGQLSEAIISAETERRKESGTTPASKRAPRP